MISDEAVADAVGVFDERFVKVFDEALKFKFALCNLNLLRFCFECVGKLAKLGDIVFCCYFVGVTLV